MRGAFGKLPSTGDFVRHGVSAPVALELEKLLHAGVDALHDERAVDAFAQGRTYGVLLSMAGRADVVVGALGPSRDSVGRRFPFVVFDVLEGHEAPRAQGHVVPLAAGEFLDFALRLSARPNLSLGDLPGALEQAPPVADGLSLLGREYADWTRRTSLGDAFNAIYGDPFSPFARAAIIGLAACVEPWRGTEYPATSLAARLPLGAGGAAALAFWLDVVRRVSAWRERTPTVFWHWTGAAGDALVHLGDTPPQSLVELYRPDPGSDLVYDLMPTDRPPAVLPPTRFVLQAEALLHRPEAPVAALLEALAG